MQQTERYLFNSITFEEDEIANILAFYHSNIEGFAKHAKKIGLSFEDFERGYRKEIKFYQDFYKTVTGNYSNFEQYLKNIFN